MGLLSFFSSGGNYGLIARNIAFYHEYLRRDYIFRFSRYEQLVFVAGVLDMWNYVRRSQVAVESIAQTTRGALFEDLVWPESHDEMMCHLYSFTCDLEVLIFSIHHPTWDNRSGVDRHGESIEQNLKQVVGTFSQGECANPSIEVSVHAWMNSELLEDIRKRVGM
jgi:hypothetical protein